MIKRKKPESPKNNPAKTSRKNSKENNDPKKSIFQRLGPTKSIDANRRKEHYSKQHEKGKKELSQRF